jgi:hypothetical protein
VKVLLVSGSRKWGNEARVREFLTLFRDKFGFDTLREGECTGLDLLARKVGEELGYAIDPIPADWDRLGKRAGRVRNQAMHDKEPQPRALIAFHDNLPWSRGTKHMVEVSTTSGLYPVLHVTKNTAFWLGVAGRVEASV